MQKEQNQNTKTDFNSPDNRSTTNGFIGEDTPSEKKEAEDQQKNTCDIKKEPHNIIVNVPEKKDKAAKTANIIAFCSLIVAALLAICTYKLFTQATADSKTAVASATAAQDAVKEQRYNDGITRDRDSIKFRIDTAYASKKFREDSVVNSKNFGISKNALQAQINSLKQSQKDFETENRPFIIYSDITIDTPIINHDINIHYVTKNVGKFPAKISSAYANINWGIDSSKKLVQNLWLTKATKLFLSNGDNFPVTINKAPFSDYYIKVFKEGIIHVYLFLRINYYSGVLSKEYSSYNVVEISYSNNKLDYTTIENK